MAKELMKEKSVEQLYDYPESGVMNKELCFLVLSVEKKESNRVYVELTDLKYKIRNVILITEKEQEDIKVGDYIQCQEFKYKYYNNVEITVTNFKKIDCIKEYKKEEFIDCYFKYIKKDNSFIGFNGETLKIDKSKTKIEYEDSKIYLFHRLQKLSEKKAEYNEKTSIISECPGDYISNDNIEKLSSNIPYCFEGKVIEKSIKDLTMVIKKIDGLFFILKFNKFCFYQKNSKYVKVSSAKNLSTDGNIVNLQETPFTKIEALEFPEEKIERIYFKFTFFGELKDNIISKFMIELNEKENDEIIINKHYAYYMYNNKCDSDLFYFIQNVKLLYKNGISRKFSFFTYIGFLNEINVDINQIGICAYEFLFYALDKKYLPNNIELKEQKKFDNFQTFGNETRKKISFINIQVQNDEDIGHGNSFLVIKLCKKNETKLYGTMKLNSIEFNIRKKYNINYTLKEFLKDIHQEFVTFFRTCGNINKIKDKYLFIDKNLCSMIEEELNKNFNLLKIEDEESTFEYFDSLVIWNIFNYLNKNKSSYIQIKYYLERYDKVKAAKINYVEKSLLLIGLFDKLTETKKDYSIPELYFYEELPEKNPYKMAYNFQFLFIENLTELSGLFQPFLLLDSYFMDLICYKNLKIDKKNIKNGVISSYSISMIPLDYIKDHLKKSIKKYFFIIKRGISDERNYYACVQKDSGVVTYNEKILLEGTNFVSISSFENDNFRQDYAFLLNLENLHENFSHNKESILNTDKSPTIYFDEDFDYSYVYNKKNDTIGEAGDLLESFICDIDTLEEMKKLKYEMGTYFNVFYYVQKNFDFLIKSFKIVKKNYDEQNANNNNAESSHIEFEGLNSEVIKKDNNEVKPNNIINIEIKNENKEQNQQIEQNQQKEQKSKKEEAILLSRHNCTIIKAKTLQELFEKINDMKNKKFIQPKIVTPENDDKNFY